MLYFNRIDVSEGIGINKTRESKEYNCHCWYFLKNGFELQPDVCNACHNLLMMSMNVSDIAISNIKFADYCCIISGISKSEIINLMQNIDLTEKSGTL